MGILYAMSQGNTMEICKNKLELDEIRAIDEIVVPVGDRDSRIGWTLMPISEYVRTRYVERWVKS